MDVSQQYGAMIGPLFHIKELMKSLFDTRGRYRQTFPPPFIIEPDSPEYMLLCRMPGKARRKLRKRGSRSGVQVGIGDALQPAWDLPSFSMEDAHGVCARSLTSLSVTAHPRCRLLGPQGSSTSLHNAGVLVSGFRHFHTFPCSHQFLLHRPAGANVTAGRAFDQSRCVPRTLPPWCHQLCISAC